MKENQDSNGKQISSEQIDFESSRNNTSNDKNISYPHEYFIVLLLFLTNLLNFVDRYSLAGIFMNTNYLDDYNLIESLIKKI